MEEQLSKLREEIVFRTTLLDQMVSARNSCAHGVLDSLELLIGKDHKHWVTIRKVILDSVNDYHRFVCNVLEKTM